MFASLTSKGQITIPNSIRKKLKLEAGDKLDFVVLDNDSIHVIPLKQSAKKLKGLVKAPKQVVSLDEMNQAIESNQI